MLTVDNHCDGVYLYLRVLRDDPSRADEVLELLRWNGGNASGIGIANVDWSGNVHADQFWQQHTFGNVKERPFCEIWMDAVAAAAGGAEGPQSPAQGPLRGLPLPRPVQRQLPGARRGRPRRPLGPRPGVLPERRGDRG